MWIATPTARNDGKVVDCHYEVVCKATYRSNPVKFMIKRADMGEMFFNGFKNREEWVGRRGMFFGGKSFCGKTLDGWIVEGVKE